MITTQSVMAMDRGDEDGELAQVHVGRPSTAEVHLHPDPCYDGIMPLALFVR